MIVLVALGGAIGAMARYAVDLLLGARWSARRGRGRRGVALAVINITGSLLIGLVAGLALRGLVSDELRTVLATGVLGAVMGGASIVSPSLRGRREEVPPPRRRGLPFPW